MSYVDLLARLELDTAAMIDPWWQRNSVPPCPREEERRHLGTWVRDWHPAYNVGDLVKRNSFLASEGRTGKVVRFDWAGTHLIAVIDFGSRVERFVASEYEGIG